MIRGFYEETKTEPGYLDYESSDCAALSRLSLEPKAERINQVDGNR